MSGWEKLRRYISQILVEKNPTLVQEMQNHNNIYGRSKSIWGRAKLVGRLYWNYVIWKKNPIEVKEDRFAKAEFPESKEKNQPNKEEILGRVKNGEVLVFDFFHVMVNVALTRERLVALLEVVSGHLGLSEETRGKEYLLGAEQKIWVQILSDFSVKNEFISDVWNEAQRKKLNIAIRNNSEYEDVFVKKIMESKGIIGKIYDGTERAVFVTTISDKEKDVIYKNVNLLGDSFRPFLQKNVITELYCQIVNSHLHSGKTQYPMFYEYGFTCGGILACGFCQFLNDLALRENIDRFVFVARDGYILQKIYQQYFELHGHTYLVFSRFASYELIFEDFPEEYLDKNVKARMFRNNTDNSIRAVLRECHLEVMEKVIYDEGLDLDEQMNADNYEQLKDILLKHKKKIQREFQESCEAAEQYILQKVNGAKKICVVDLGWHGKSIVYLKHLLKNKYSWNGEVTGAMIGASGDYVTQSYIRSGIINAYAFENDYWRRMGRHNGEIMTEEEIICIEALFSSEAKTLLRYRFDKNGKIEFIYGIENANKEKIMQTHAGIMDFAKHIFPIIRKYHLKITARDAYTPLDCMMHNESFRKNIYQSYKEVTNAINGFEGK